MTQIRRIGFMQPDGVVRIGLVCADCQAMWMTARLPEDHPVWTRPTTGTCQLCALSSDDGAKAIHG